MENVEMKGLSETESDLIRDSLLTLLNKKNQVTVITSLLNQCPETAALFSTFNDDIQHQAGFLISMYKRGVNLMCAGDHDELYEIFARHPKYNISVNHVSVANDSVLSLLNDKLDDDGNKDMTIEAWKRCQENFIVIMSAAYKAEEKASTDKQPTSAKVAKNRKRVFRTVSVSDISNVTDQFATLTEGKAEAASSLTRLLMKESVILKVFHAHSMNVADQSEVIFDMVGTAISRFSDVDTLIPWLRALGSRHAQMNIPPRLLSSMKPILIRWLGECLGFNFTDETRESWVRVLSLIIGLMIEGGRKGGDKNSTMSNFAGDGQSVMSMDADGNAVELQEVDIQRCQKSWNAVQKVLNIAVKSFYKDLVTSKAEIRNLFSSSNMEEQANKLVRAIGSTIEMLTDLDGLLPILEELGRRHVYYSVLPSHFKYLKLAWFRMLENALSFKWTKEMKNSWNIVWHFITKIMRTSLEDAYLLYTPPDPDRVQLKLLINHIDRIETQHMSFWADIWYAAFTNDNPSQSAAFGPEAYNNRMIQDTFSEKPSWQISMLNGLETNELFAANGEKCAKKYATSDGKNQWYIRGNVRGKFSQAFDIHAFPFDTHKLQIKFSLLVDESRATFYDENLRVRLMPFKLDMMGGTDWDVFTPIIYAHRQSAVAGGSSSGKKYTHCIAEIPIARRWKHHIWDTFVPLLLIEIMVFSVYFASVHPLAKRMAVVATLLLTLFTFKTMVAESMPPTPYSTIMDYFFHVAKIFLLLHCYAQVFIILWEGHIQNISHIVGAVLFAMFTAVHIALFWKCWQLIKKYPKEEHETANSALMTIAKSTLVSNKFSVNTSIHQNAQDKSMNVEME